MLNIGRYHIQFQTKNIIQKSNQLKKYPLILKQNYCNVINNFNKDYKIIQNFQQLTNPQNLILTTQCRYFLKNKKGGGQDEEAPQKPRRFTNPENDNGFRNRAFTKVEQDEFYVFDKKEQKLDQINLGDSQQSLLSQLLENREVDDRTIFQKQGLIDYDLNEILEFEAENQQKVKDYLDSLNQQQRTHLLEFYNQNKTRDQSFLDYNDKFEQIVEKIQVLSPQQQMQNKQNEQLAEFFKELPREGQILLNQLVDKLNQKESSENNDLEYLLDLSLSWQKLKEANNDEQFQSILQSNFNTKNWHLENLNRILIKKNQEKQKLVEEAEQKHQKSYNKAFALAKFEQEDNLLNSGINSVLLGSKLKVSEESKLPITAPTLKQFKNELEEKQEESIGKALFLQDTPQGNSIQKLKEIITAFRVQTRDKWTSNQVNRFVISYLKIYRQFKISKYYSSHSDLQMQEALQNELQDLELISQKVRESIKNQMSENENSEQVQINSKANQEFVQNVKKLATQNLDFNIDQKKDRTMIHDALEKCLYQKGLLPFSEKHKNDHKHASFNLKEQQERENELKYQEYMRKVLYNELNLQNNSKFWAFLADIALNTAQTNKFIKEDTIQDEILQELGLENKYQKSYPLADRFINLLLSLHDPTHYKNFTHASNNYFKELGITYNLKNKDAAVGFNVIKDPEYMLKYQLVSLAKFHNFYGSMDQYMKEFAKICISTENKNVIKNLQNLLNAEVSISNEQSQEQLLKHYKTLPREVDPMLLAQPEFRFSLATDKIKMIQNYLDLVKEQDRTREAILLLEKSTSDPLVFRQLTSSFDTLVQLLEEIDQDQSNYDIVIGKKVGTFEKFKKTSGFIDDRIKASFLSLYGIDGIGFNNLEDVYSPLVSGFGQLQDTRAYLIKKGMTVQFADLLAAKYIRKLEDPKTSKICTIMDFFDTKRDSFQAMKILADANIKNVFINYTTLNAYSRLINNAEMIKTMSSTFKMPQSTQFAISKNPKIQPIRPITPSFSQNQNSQKKLQIFGGGSLRAFSDSQGGRGRFFDFLKIAESVDEKVKTQQDQEELESKNENAKETEYNFQNIDVSFQSNPQNRLESVFSAEQMKEMANQDHVEIFANQDIKEQNERQQLIQDAIKKYDINFYMQFAFTGKDFLKFSQKNLEEFIVKLESQEDVNLLLLSMINQSYELNHLIPNIELMIFKIFCSPISTKEIRKEQEEQNILAGNIFVQKNMKLDKDVYFSLLHTLQMRPKKKHFKKVVAYIRNYTEPKDISPKIIDQIVSIGIDMKIPVTLGQLVRDMIIQDDCNIQKSTFMKFLAFMEKSKGYEEDAKKFLTLVTQESSSLQIDYEMCRPIILRMMKYKGGPEVIKFFEQLRKNIKLNKANSQLPQNEKNQLIKDIRKGFFTGLMKDLMENKTYQLAEIVMSELHKEKLDTVLEDEVIALNIYAAQKKLAEYKQKFNLFFIDKSEGGYELTQSVTVELSRTLMEFQDDEFKNDRLMMAEKLNRKMQQNLLVYEGEVIHNIIFIYAESQQWNEVANVLKAQVNPKLCFPVPKTLNYLKQNLVYIFQTSQRQAVSEALEQFEQTFFSYKLKYERSSQKSKYTNESEQTKMDDIKGEDIKEKGDKDKKLMRRQARQESKQTEGDETNPVKQEAQKESEKDIKEKQ